MPGSVFSLVTATGSPLLVTNSTSHDTRADLAQLINDLAVVNGNVTLASGKEADYYVDLRRATLHHRAAPLIGHVMLDMLEESGFGPDDVDAVGGLDRKSVV